MQKGTTLLGATLQFKSTFQRNSTPNRLNQWGGLLYVRLTHILLKLLKKLLL